MALYLGAEGKSKIALKFNAPSAIDVTFGYEDNSPVQRDSKYVVNTSTLNELGAIVQNASGNTGLLTIDEMVSWLANEARFLATGNAQSSTRLSWNMQTSATGTLQDLATGNAQSNNRLAWNMQTTATGTLQEE